MPSRPSQPLIQATVFDHQQGTREQSHREEQMQDVTPSQLNAMDLSLCLQTPTLQPQHGTGGESEQPAKRVNSPVTSAMEMQ
jgi:hypothetical protein